MDVSVPYKAGMLLGRAMDMRTLKPGLMLPGSERPPEVSEVNTTSLQYSFVHTFKDVCDVLAVPPEYALKTEAHITENAVVLACLKALESKNSITLIFRGTFLHQKKYLPYNFLPLKAKQEGLGGDQAGEMSESCITERLLADAVGDMEVSQSSWNAHKDTHWVKAVEIGNEIITIVTFASSDTEKLDKFRTKWSVGLGSFRGTLSQAKLQELKKLASETDKKLSKKHYADSKLEVSYGFFYPPASCPNTVTGAILALENFSDQCIGWTQMCQHGQVYPLEASIMDLKIGESEEKSTWEGIRDSVSRAVTYVKGSSDMKAHGEVGSPESDVDHDSFVVLETAESRHFYTLQVTMQSLEGDESDVDQNASVTSLAQSQYPESTNELYRRLHCLLNACNKAADKMQRFLGSQRFQKEANIIEGQRVLKSLQDTHYVVYDFVRQLDMVTVPEALAMEEILSVQPLDTVNFFIEAVTTKLPPGGDLDLLLIGKTGHGKSSTGNSILGQSKFYSAADSDSVTNKSGVGWASVDKRTIKVVDTPGVCDTHLASSEASIDMAIQSISEAIAHCPDGFHALLLIIRFGTRMTDEEKRAIGLLKCVLGEDVIRSHCVCVITHGDNFETEMADKKLTFEQWCYNQKGYLKELFEECGYRCVLFNNKAKDARAKKTQLIQLVDKVDSLKGHGTRYTNAIFQFAKSERQRIQKEERVPEVSEDMVRDLQLVLEYLNGMVHNTDETRYKEELSELREKVNDLGSRISEVDNGHLNNLVNSVFALAETLHTKMDEIADRQVPDIPEQAAAASGQRGDNYSPSSSPHTSLIEHYNDLQECVNTNVARQEEQLNLRVAEQVQGKVKEDGNQCFPGCSQVWLKDGKRIPLRELEVGDQVLVRDSHGRLTFDTVYMFGHHDSDTHTSFMVLETDAGEVRVSQCHYLFCVREGEEVCLTAEEVGIGDQLLGLGSLESKTLEGTVVKGSRVERCQGLFAPFTLEGTVVVDDHLMSCYVQCVSHTTAHLLLAPVRQLYKISPNALALANGKMAVPWWARVAMRALKS